MPNSSTSPVPQFHGDQNGFGPSFDPPVTTAPGASGCSMIAAVFPKVPFGQARSTVMPSPGKIRPSLKCAPPATAVASAHFAVEPLVPV